MARKKNSEIADIQDVFSECEDAWSEHHNRYLKEYRFNRLNKQWSDAAIKARGPDRPQLTVNKVQGVIKQIVNDCRQNKPSIKVRPVDDGADPDTAEIYSGLIRNIEQISKAGAAYDTAVDCAASGGFGFFRIKLDYAFNDAFDLDILIDRIANPLSVYGDPYSTAVDSSDWNNAFITDLYSEEAFKQRWPDAEAVSWSGDKLKTPSGSDTGDDVTVGEYWCRTEVDKTIVKLSDGKVLGEAEYLAQKDMLDAIGVTVVGSRKIKAKQVKQKLVTGAEILEVHDWPGMWIPIVPVYGDEHNDEGTRIFRSAVWYAQDAQRRYNYWTTTSTELVALAPKVPFIGHERAFQGEDAAKWATINTANHSYVSVPDGAEIPQRQPLDSGPAAGAMQEALIAADEIKATTGIYDAGLGNRSNETSGRAINARKVESDTATYHFTDNLARGIEHGGRILIDLIPKVYTADRMIRVLGDDGHVQNVRLGKPEPTTEQRPGQRKKFDGVYDLAAGKYDLAVDTGPSYTTRRVETREEIMALIQAAPDVASRVADILAKNMDWKDADLIAERLAPPDAANIPPEVQQQIEEGKLLLQQQQDELEKLKSDRVKDVATIEKAKTDKAAQDLKRLEISLEEKRLPLDQMQKEIELVTARIGLVNAQAQANATTTEANASAGEKNANASAMNEFAAAVAGLTQAAAAMQASLADVQLKANAPRVKQGRAVKQPDGSWQLNTIEAA